MVVCATGGTRNRNHRLDFTELLAMGLFCDTGMSLLLWLFSFFPLWKQSASWLLLSSPAAYYKYLFSLGHSQYFT